ncbi:methyltransferase, TIGR04325 family, partial [bacterium NHP-B]
SLLISCLLTKRSDAKKVLIFDVGGSMGGHYLELLAKVPCAEKEVLYHIVEGAATLRHVPHDVRAMPSLSFSEKVGDVASCDVLHIGSTLQYIEDWSSFLKRLLQTSPTYCVFSDLMVGEGPSFVSHQLFYDKKIPVQFLCFQDVHSFMNDAGYELTYQSFFQADVFGSSILPMKHLPQDKQIPFAKNLIFAKK